MAGTLRLRFVYFLLILLFTVIYSCSREHLQEVISLLSNEPKSSSLPLNENKQEEEEIETTFADSVKQKLINFLPN